MSDRDDAVSLVLTDSNFIILIELVRKELKREASNERLDHFAALLTDMNTQWREQVIERVYGQSNP